MLRGEPVVAVTFHLRGREAETQSCVVRGGSSSEVWNTVLMFTLGSGLIEMRIPFLVWCWRCLSLITRLDPAINV